MTRTALLLCRSQQSLVLLKDVLGELEIMHRVSESAGEAMGALLEEKLSALILDFDLPGALQVAKIARTLAPEHRPVVFAMIGSTPVGGAFHAGVNFVLYKPLDREQVGRSLRAGYGFMHAERRRSVRHRPEGLVYLQLGADAVPALMLDVSEHGLALQAPEPIPRASKIPLRFVLPGSGQTVEATGEIIWSDDHGRAGMFFSRLGAASRRNLKNWLAKQGADKKNAVRVLLKTHQLRHSPFPVRSLH